MPEAANDPTTSPHVAIAIVATDEQKNIVNCLKSIDKFFYRNFSVLICENSGPDAYARDLAEIAKLEGVEDAASGAPRSGQADDHRFLLGADQRPVMVMRARQNLGYSGGVNACIAAARNWDFIWVLNPDTFPEPDALGALLRRQALGGYGIVGSKVVFVSNGLVQLWGGLQYYSLLGRCRSLGVNLPADRTPNVEEVEAKMDIVSGVSMLVSKAYIDKVGVMDEEFFVYFEDTEWSLRRGSFRLGYAHDSVIHHLAGATSGSGGPRRNRSRFSIYLSERNRILIAKKRSPHTWPAHAVFGLMQTFEHLLRFRTVRGFRIALEGWWAGVVGEKGMPGFMRGSQGAAAKVFLKRAD